MPKKNDEESAPNLDFTQLADLLKMNLLNLQDGGKSTGLKTKVNAEPLKNMASKIASKSASTGYGLHL
ncbi:hypothetical protein [Neobacillus terrae]|uniref:hypothetical protein n=1 Tax=Neobacillus terrae TaxID=3034837 RepID=UPI00140DE3FD|nr:hypothetical protein [Neobacillus terrae]NHM32653.1 hypothetical protein [Neobacillus terrae]